MDFIISVHFIREKIIYREGYLKQEHFEIHFNQSKTRINET